MALVDADYKFIWMDVGANGSASDVTNVVERPRCAPTERKFRIGWDEIWREEKNKMIGITLFQIYLTSATSSDD